jgi:hypothetical protein
MKTIVFFLMIMGLTGTVLGQKDPVSVAFEKFAGKNGYTVVNVSGDMLKMITQIEEQRKDTTFMSKLNEVRILVRDKCSEVPATSFRTEVYDKLDKSVYKEMMTVKQNDEDVVILIKELNGRINEFLIIVGGDNDNVLIQAKGDILLSEMAEMAGACHMKGFEHLKQMEK